MIGWVTDTNFQATIPDCTSNVYGKTRVWPFKQPFGRATRTASKTSFKFSHSLILNKELWSITGQKAAFPSTEFHSWRRDSELLPPTTEKSRVQWGHNTRVRGRPLPKCFGLPPLCWLVSIGSELYIRLWKSIVETFIQYNDGQISLLTGRTCTAKLSSFSLLLTVS